MKSGLLVLCMVLWPLAAQNNSEIKHLTIGPAINDLIAVPKVRLGAQSLEQTLGIVHLKGSVEIDLGAYKLLADEAEYQQDTGEIQPHGNIRLKSTPSLHPGGVGQFGVR